jgi:hypothetical protein
MARDARRPDARPDSRPSHQPIGCYRSGGGILLCGGDAAVGINARWRAPELFRRLLPPRLRPNSTD